jgi:hypothetical protein
MPCRRTVSFVPALAALVTLALAACSEAEPEAAEESLPTIPPSTTLVVDLPIISGMTYCEVAEQVAQDVQAFADPGSDFADVASVEQTYVAAYQAFDAMSQVATREIAADVDLVRTTLEETVRVASQAGWDLSTISATVNKDAGSDDVAAALARLREYTSESCGVDLIDPETPATTGAPESRQDRQRRVVLDTFPYLTSAQVSCVADALPADFDPDAVDVDEDLVAAALRSCGAVAPQPPSTDEAGEVDDATGDTLLDTPDG